MVRRGGYRTQAQKEGRSAGQRKRRQARKRKRRLREANLYKVAVRSSVVSKARRDDGELAVYGIYKDESEGEWVLTGMAVRRSEEKLVSDRQGATRSEVRDRSVVSPRHEGLDPRDGLEVGRFDTKKAAMREASADSSSRLDSGEYVVRSGDWSRSMQLHKVDRDEYRDWLRSRQVQRVRD